MFLQKLKEDERKAFLELAHYVANASGVMNEAEHEMIDTYDREMGIDLTLEDLEDKSLETIVTAFKSDYSKKATFIEAVAIALADGVYDSEERVVIDRLRQVYGFSVEYYEQVKSWLQEFNRIYRVGMELTK